MSDKFTDDIAVATRYLRMSKKAKDRGIDFQLSFSCLKRLLNTKRCYFTKEELCHDDGAPNQLTIDRVDNDLPYMDSNVVACSARINSLKGKLTVSDISSIFKGLKRRGLVK